MAPKFAAGRWFVDNAHRFYSTDENFDNSGGNRVALSDGNELKLHHNLTTVHYGLSDDFDLFTGFRFASVSTVTGDISRSNTGFSDLIFGGNYRWLKGRTAFYPGIEINVPLFGIEPDTDNAFFNEGAWEFTAKLYADHKWSFLDVYGQLAFSLLSDGRGGRGYAHLGLRKKIAKFLLQAEVNGMDTVINDSLTDQSSTRTDVVNRVQGGSLAFYSVNPGVLRMAGQVAMQVHPSTAIGLGYSRDLIGSRHSSGYALNTFLRIEPEKLFKSFGKKNRSRSSDEFIPESEGDDLKYFDADPSRPKKKPKKRKRLKKSSGEGNSF